MVLLTVMALFPNKVWGALGDRVAPGTGKSNLGLADSANSTTYTVRSSVVQGIQVHEYISNGIVFAVTWTGLTKPDLSVVLGEKYFSELQTSGLNLSGIKGHPKRVWTLDDFVVETSGHMRRVHGLAYLPDAVPVGLDLESLP